MSPKKLAALKAYLPNGMKISRNTRTELNSLTQAFHMNLTALGMLSFLVGLFIFYQAMSLSLVQRQTIVGMLRQIGVSGWQLALALCVELLLLILGSWVCGNLLGLVLANQLIPAVSLTIGAIYNASVGVSISWSWEWSKLSLLMVLAGAMLSCTWPLIRLLVSQPIRLTSKVSLVRFAGKEFFWQAILAAICCTAAIGIYQAPHTNATGFIITGLMLIGVALFMPFVVFEIFNFLSYRLKWVKARWFFADAASSMSYRGLALMAFMLAMTANIGVETMVGSFRNTTDKWLNQRLAADIYVQPTISSSNRMTNWLMKQPEVEEVWHRWENEVISENGTLDVVSIGASKGELESLSEKITTPNYWYHLHHSKSVMISESMSIKLNIVPGDHISLPTPLGKGWQVVGVYYDYGNPFNQVLLSHLNWKRAFGNEGTVNLGILLKDGADSEKLASRLNSTYRISAERMEDNKSIHQQALRVFDRTFVIADTLGNLTLVIAVFGIFLSTLAGEISRQRHVALLRCLGISAKELVILGGLQLLVFGFVAALIAIPLGLALAQNVIDLILKHSFGWTIELEVIPWEYLETIAWTVGALMLAGSIPVIQIINRTPMKSLRDAL
jgi:putative ABC transport system permease protein